MVTPLPCGFTEPERRRLEIVSPLLIRVPWELPVTGMACCEVVTILVLWEPESRVEEAPDAPDTDLVFKVEPLTLLRDDVLVADPPERLPLFRLFMPYLTAFEPPCLPVWFCFP